MMVVWLQQAGADLDTIVDYLLEHDPQAAVDIHDAIRQQVGKLADFPRIGRPGRVAGTRELVLAGLPYIVPYYIKGGEVRILAVVHTSRKWPDEFEVS
jgi:plasmid stabilization system protein ParE